MVMCDAYDGPARPSIEEYRRGLPTHTARKRPCSVCGKELRPKKSQLLTVNNQIILPPKQYIGDRMGAAIGKMTGRTPCRGCRKVEGAFNWSHRSLEKLLT